MIIDNLSISGGAAEESIGDNMHKDPSSATFAGWGHAEGEQDTSTSPMQAPTASTGATSAPSTTGLCPVSSLVAFRTCHCQIFAQLEGFLPPSQKNTTGGGGGCAAVLGSTREIRLHALHGDPE